MITIAPSNAVEIARLLLALEALEEAILQDAASFPVPVQNNIKNAYHHIAQAHKFFGIAATAAKIVDEDGNPFGGK